MQFSENTDQSSRLVRERNGDVIGVIANNFSFDIDVLDVIANHYSRLVLTFPMLLQTTIPLLLFVIAVRDVLTNHFSRLTVTFLTLL